MKLNLKNKSSSILLCSLSIFFITFLLFNNLYAQTSGKLSGRILDNEGNPMVGANVLIEGTTQGAATDFDGYYNDMMDKIIEYYRDKIE